ncbi:hypothetical protein HHL17_20425 [Chitinophaga sp. G-6-1-13]|uniref:Uncharacterized protein n=1 Tax=Chitinophaga fulva TaxID=2728842 RepID=A0A848GV35_9BACT|nr:hypothetical protein [Chitinophaga fulva]NML39578.1 hypothetical protein [Chitinophaga fulva]
MIKLSKLTPLAASVPVRLFPQNPAIKNSLCVVKGYLLLALLLLFLTSFHVSTQDPTVVGHLYNANNANFAWIKLGTLSLPQEGSTATIRFHGGSGYNGLLEQMGQTELHIRTSNGNSNPNGYPFSAYATRTGYSVPVALIKIIPNVSGTAPTSYDIYIYHGGYAGYSIYEVVTISGAYQRIEQITAAPTQGYDVPFNFTVQNDVNLANALRANYTTGNVTIGYPSKKSQLMVNGDIFANRVKVSTENWPDYVFNPEFELRPISDLARYIADNKHLPDLPAAKEVETKGQDVGEINKILVKKMEEMSLYIIQLDQRMKELEEKLNKK